MPGISATRATIPLGGSGVDWSSYWTTQKLQERYMSLGFGGIIMYSLTEFVDDGWDTITGHVSGNVFNPTDLDIDEWLDACQAAGMNYVVIYTMNHDGFCMWNTDTHVGVNDPYSVEYSTWGIANGTPDLVKLQIDGCRARGLQPYLYFSMWDAEWERLTGTTHVDNAAGLIAYKKEQITELLTRYGEIGAFWIDGWGWHIPYTVGAGVPYDVIYDHIKSKQRNCLVINNDHTHPPVRTDIDVYEIPYEYPPSGNTIPLEVYQGMRRDNKGGFWLDLTETINDFMTAPEVKAKIALYNNNHANYLLGVTPNNTGHIATPQLNVLNAIATATASIGIDTFTWADGIRINVIIPDLGGMWTENVGTWKTYANRIFLESVNATGFATKDYGVADIDITSDILMPAENNYVAIILFRYTDTTHQWRLLLERDAGGIPYIALVENAATVRISPVNVTQENNTIQKMRVTAHDEVITIFWNGVQKGQYTSASYKTITNHGIATYNDANFKRVYFDNFIVNPV